jgi:hypothetical protein
MDSIKRFSRIVNYSGFRLSSGSRSVAHPFRPWSGRDFLFFDNACPSLRALRTCKALAGCTLAPPVQWTSLDASV